MSLGLAEDVDIGRRFPTAVCVSPKFPEEPSLRRAGKIRAKGVKAKGATASKAKVVAELQKQLDATIFLLLVTAQSTQQFDDLRRELFPEFVELSGAISTLIGLPKGDRDDIANQLFANLAGQFAADDWLLTRVEAAKDEARFCLETLHRAHFLAEDVCDGLKSGTLPPESQKGYADALASEWWSILHLRCIVFAIRHKIAPADEVFAALMEGFRHSVMSYAHAREAIEPRYHADYESIDFSKMTPSNGDYAPYDHAPGV